MQKTPIDQPYLQSYLIKAGIRFDFNVIDTVCAKKFSATFYMVLITILLILSVPQGMPGNTVPQGASAVEYSSTSSDSLTMYYIVVAILSVWIVYYLSRLSYYMTLRAKLRSDPAPLSVEAYAVVCLDVKTRPIDYLYQVFSIVCGRGKNGFCRYAVIYKEIGTEQPRFFLTAALSPRRICFIPEHIGRVFIHRTKPHLYTLDDKSAYQTVSAKRKVMSKFAMPASTMACTGNQHQDSTKAAASKHTNSSVGEENIAPSTTIKAQHQPPHN